MSAVLLWHSGWQVHHKAAYDAPMPAKNPRLTITMQPTLHALFRRLSELTGQSQSALVFELLDGAQPVLTKVCRLLEASESAKGQMKGLLASEMESAQDRIESQLGLALADNFNDEVAGDILREAETVRYRARRSADGKRSAVAERVARVEPPVSNRGVRSLTTSQKKAERKVA